jgi:hypothetical protein
MTRRVWPLGLPLVIGLAGCMSTGEGTALVSHSTFPATPAEAGKAAQAPHAPATEEAARVVLTTARKVVDANPGLGAKPVFLTVGAPAPEIFHQGDRQVVITEGLARQCKTEGQLAAVLATELAKMASERRALAGASLPDPGLPISAPVGNDSRGAFGSPDATGLMELAKYEQQHKRRQEIAAAPPAPPADLAKGYLKRAGYDPADADAVAPLLRAAEGNAAVERAMTAAAK